MHGNKALDFTPCSASDFLPPYLSVRSVVASPGSPAFRTNTTTKDANSFNISARPDGHFYPVTSQQASLAARLISVNLAVKTAVAARPIRVQPHQLHNCGSDQPYPPRCPPPSLSLASQSAQRGIPSAVAARVQSAVLHHTSLSERHSQVNPVAVTHADPSAT